MKHTDLTDEELRKAMRDTKGAYRTKSLFRELSEVADRYPFFFNLGDEDDAETISFRKHYMEIGDPTEYNQARALLGSWEHWKTLSNSPIFTKYFENLRLELKTKLASEAFASIQSESKSGSPRSLDASKFVIGYLQGPPATRRGRPSKDERKGFLKALAKDTSEVDEDMERINL